MSIKNDAPLALHRKVSKDLKGEKEEQEAARFATPSIVLYSDSWQHFLF